MPVLRNRLDRAAKTPPATLAPSGVSRKKNGANNPMQALKTNIEKLEAHVEAQSATIQALNTDKAHLQDKYTRLLEHYGRAEGELDFSKKAHKAGVRLREEPKPQALPPAAFLLNGKDGVPDLHNEEDPEFAASNAAIAALFDELNKP